MKILLFRSNNLFASRVNKYVDYYQSNRIPYTAVGWDRTGSGVEKDNYDFFRFEAGISSGGLKAVVNHFKWMRFVYNYIKKHNDVTTVHACDLNSAFPAVVYKSLHNNNLNVIFDVCDWFSANFHDNKLLLFFLGIMERYTCNHCNEIIICEPERREQICFKLKKEPLVLPNIPNIKLEALDTIDQKQFKFDNDNVTIGYFGGFSVDRFQLELLELVKTEPFNLLIAGFGDLEVEEKCKEVSELPNVKYWGKCDVLFGLALSKSADITYAMYCKTNPNNVFAAPNKVYEALFLGNPIITTKGIIVEKKVEKYKIGYAIEEDIEELRSLIRKLDKKELKELGDNSRLLWQSKYKDYVTLFFSNEYSKIIKQNVNI